MSTIEELEQLKKAAILLGSIGCTTNESFLIDKGHFEQLLRQLRNGSMPATIGYAINETIFNLITETFARHIHKYGWTVYVDYMESWRLKILP